MAATNPPAKTELEVAVRGRLGLGADADDATVLTALEAALIGPAADPDPEPVTLEPRTIQHSLFSYDLPEGGQAIAFRGSTVNLLPHDIERGERFDAFTAEPGVLPEPAGSTLPGYPIDGSEAEQDAWVGSGSVQEIVAYVNGNPESIDSILAAEQRRGTDSRKTLLDALAKIAGTA